MKFVVASMTQVRQDMRWKAIGVMKTMLSELVKKFGTRRENRNIHEIYEPICRGGQAIRWSPNPQWHNFDLVQPRHALPTNCKEDQEPKQENCAGDFGKVHVVFPP